jgi:hypothetical protein
MVRLMYYFQMSIVGCLRFGLLLEIFILDGEKRDIHMVILFTDGFQKSFSNR